MKILDPALTVFGFILLSIIIIKFYKYHKINNIYGIRLLVLIYLSIWAFGGCVALLFLISNDTLLYFMIILSNVFFTIILISINGLIDYFTREKISNILIFLFGLGSLTIATLLFEVEPEVLVQNYFNHISYDLNYKWNNEPIGTIVTQIILMITFIRLTKYLIKISKLPTTEYNLSMKIIFGSSLFIFAAMLLGFLLHSVFDLFALTYVLPVLVLFYANIKFFKLPFPFIFLDRILIYSVLYGKNKKLISVYDYKNRIFLDDSEMINYENMHSMYFHNVPEILNKHQDANYLNVTIDNKEILILYNSDFKIVLLLNKSKKIYRWFIRWIEREIMKNNKDEQEMIQKFKKIAKSAI